MNIQPSSTQPCRDGFWRVLLVLIALVSLGACSSIAVNTDYDTGRSFSALKTYGWMEPKKKLVIDPLVDNALMTNRVRRAVDERLRAQGFVKAQGEQAVDFFITYHVSAETKISVDNFHGNYGYYPCWHGCYGYHGHFNKITVREYKQGTFMLDIIDPASEELIWRGVAGRRISGSKTPQERDELVHSVVSAILAKFPPGLTTTES